MIDFKKLYEPFSSKDLLWRIGSKNDTKTRAQMLIYVDARTVQDRLDAVVGPQNWQFSTRSIKSNRTVKKPNGVKEIIETNTIIGRLGIYDEEKDRWIWKEDGAENTEIEASKGGISDAFKRAAVQFGIGRYLYDANEFDTWVDIVKTDYTIYEDNKKILDGIAFKLFLKAYDKIDMLSTYLAGLDKQVITRLAPVIKELFGNKYEMVLEVKTQLGGKLEQ